MTCCSRKKREGCDEHGSSDEHRSSAEQSSAASSAGSAAASSAGSNPEGCKTSHTPQPHTNPNAGSHRLTLPPAGQAQRSSNPVGGRRSRSGTLPTHSVRAQPGAQRHPAQLGTTRRVAANTCEHREHLSQG